MSTIPDEWLTLEGFHRLWHESEAFRKFAEQVYTYLCTMPVGRGVSFERYDGTKLEWCVRTAAAFLLEGNNWRYYELSGNRLVVWHRLREPLVILPRPVSATIRQH